MSPVSLFAPWALLLGLTLPVIVLFYILKRRREERPVSSTMLWRQALRDLQANHPWQRLRRNLLLLLQLLTAFSLVIAAARPFWASDLRASHTVIVLDTGANMQATDAAPTRFAAAVASVRGLIDGLGPQDRMSIVTYGARPAVLLAGSRDKGALHRALGQAEVTAETGDLVAALKVAASLLEADSGGSIVVLSGASADAVTAAVQAAAPERLAGVDVRHERVGGDSANIAIVGFSLRRDAATEPANAPDAADGTGAADATVSALVRVGNYGSEPVSVSVGIETEGRLVTALTVALAAGEERDVLLQGLPEAPTYEASLHGPDGGALPAAVNALPVDDRAYGALPGGEPPAVLLVSTGNLFLERALGLFPRIDLLRVAPGGYSDAIAAGAGRYDLIVFDGYLPHELPAADVLAVNPPDDNALLPLGEAVRPGRLEAAPGAEAWTRFADLDSFVIGRARPPESLPAWAAPVVQSEAGPVIVAGLRDGRRTAVWAFDLHESDLPLRPAFPVLVQNLLAWYFPGEGQGSVSLTPGATVQLPLAPGAEQAAVVAPDGARTQLAPPLPPKAYTVPSDLGFYTLEQRVAGEPVTSVLAVNVFSPAESNLAGAAGAAGLAGGPGGSGSADGPGGSGPPDGPDAGADPAGAGGSGGQVIAGTAGLARRDLWPWLALLGLLILTAEWKVWSRGY